MKTNNIIFLILFSIVASFNSATFAAPASVSANLEPEMIPLNRTTTLTVSIKNAERGVKPILANVKNLTFTPIGQSSNISIINGNMTSVVRYNYRVVASKEGDFLIPAVSIKSEGRRVSSNSLTLKVSAPQKNLAQSNSLYGRELSDEEKKKIAFISIQRADNKGREYLYVGESTPVLIRLYLRSGLRVRGLNKPSISSDAFTLSALSNEPEQDIEIIDGIRYNVVSWYGNLSGIKAGDYDLTTEIKATVGVPSKQTINPKSSDPFNDPFFNSFFTNYENKELHLKSEKKQTQVISPPLKGRPDSFTGAVGQYIIKADTLPSALETGDAITLKVFVEGKGNFDRVDKPILMPTKSWKTYKEKIELERGDIVNFHARKHFSIPAVVTKPGDIKTFFQFSYFDPETEKYKTAETAKHIINVTGKSVEIEGDSNANDSIYLANDTSDLPIIKESIGSLIFSHSKLYQKTWFRGVGFALMFIMFGSIICSLLQQYRRKDPRAYRRRELSRKHKRQFDLIKRSIDEGEVVTFFQQCRLILQGQIALERGGKAEAITINEIEEHYLDCKIAIEVFKKADEVEFSSGQEPQRAMEEWLNKTRSALKEIQEALVTPPPTKNQGAWWQVRSSA